MKLNRTMRAACLLCLAATIPAAVMGLAIKPNLSDILLDSDEIISLATAKSWGDTVLWIDSRKREQFDKEHIPGALPLNENEWDECLVGIAVARSLDPDRKLVIYCNEEECDSSMDVALRLRKETGWDKVYVLDGGWPAWKRAHPDSE